MNNSCECSKEVTKHQAAKDTNEPDIMTVIGSYSSTERMHINAI